MKSIWRNISLAFPFLVTITLSYMFAGIANNSNENDSDRWEGKQKKYDLEDREKYLLKHGDLLSKEILETKRAINDLHAKLEQMQTAYENEQHELITVQMKLLK